MTTGSSLSRSLTRTGLAAALGAALAFPALANAQLKREAPTALTDAEFWSFFTTMSEPSGFFPSENFVSNEMSFQAVIPSMQRSLTPRGVYLGVGPEQNFTYIANLKPRMAIIVDIRRQNAMQHLMYKALFEQSPTRADFIARLFSRPAVASAAPNATVADLFAAADSAAPSDSAYHANHDAIIATLTRTHGFALSPEDIASIDHVFDVFFSAGPDVNYAYRPLNPNMRVNYPTYGMLQGATNADSVPMAFLATEANYQAIRELEMRNLVVPVVGDFAGPTAIRSVGNYLRERSMTVTAFYLSNVEQYLFQNRVADRFYANVATLPIDSTSTFVRSVPRIGSFGGGALNFGGFSPPGGAIVTAGSGQFTPRAGTGGSFSYTVYDSGGVRVMRLTQDSAGVTVTHVTIDSTGTIKGPGVTLRRMPISVADSLNAQFWPNGPKVTLSPLPPAPPIPNPSPRTRPTVSMMGSSLTSGLMSMRETLAAVAAGKVVTYQDIINMTTTGGWKSPR